jgi:hypothetical protein
MIFEIFKNMLSKVPEGYTRFKGEYHSGEADYLYREEHGHRIFHGPFSYVQKGNSDYIIKGEYVDNLKQGQWKFTRKNYERNSDFMVTFKDGRMTGPFVYKGTVTNIVANKIPFEIAMNLRDGLIVGDIVGLLDGRPFRGYCNEQGMADGKWTLESYNNDDHMECEEWDNGVFIREYERSTKTNSVKKMSTRLRAKLNDLLDNECNRLLQIVPRGTNGGLFLHVMRAESK